MEHLNNILALCLIVALSMVIIAILEE